MELIEDIYLKMQKLEEEGKFFEYIDDIDYDKLELVDEEYEYLKDGFTNDVLEMVARGILAVIGFANNHLFSKIRITGKENLEDISSAIITCNHIDKRDYMLVKEAVWGHRLYVAIEERYNRKGFTGKILRKSGILPISSKETVRNRFNSTISNILKEENYILFYPEGSIWPDYRKPRSYQNGTFYYSVKNNVPIVPIFITFTGTGKYEKSGKEKQILTLNILRPIFPNIAIDKKECIKEMKKEHFILCKKKYEDVYKTKLQYTTKQKS